MCFAMYCIGYVYVCVCECLMKLLDVGRTPEISGKYCQIHIIHSNKLNKLIILFSMRDERLYFGKVDIILLAIPIFT